MRDEKMLLGVFLEEDDAENAIDELKDAHYDAKEISVITKDRGDAQAIHESTGASVGEGAASGAATGGVIGGLTGLLIGIGAISIPGLGPLLIGGPIASALGLTGAAATTISGALTGALAGGLVGALVSLGVPEEDARIYEDRVREGAILVAVPVRERNEDEVRALLEDNGAERVRSFNMNTARRNVINA